MKNERSYTELPFVRDLLTIAIDKIDRHLIRPIFVGGINEITNGRSSHDDTAWFRWWFDMFFLPFGILRGWRFANRVALPRGRGFGSFSTIVLHVQDVLLCGVVYWKGVSASSCGMSMCWWTVCVEEIFQLVIMMWSIWKLLIHNVGFITC